MSGEQLPCVYLARHGETAWTISGQHTGRTDLPLTERGEQNARGLGELIGGEPFERVFVSPLKRTRTTCELAGFGDRAEPWDELLEWDYGQYEGKRTVDIRQERPDWQLFRDGCPGGETAAEVGSRCDVVIQRIRDVKGNVLLFSSAHFFRVLAARWLGLEPAGGRYFYLGTATLSILGYEHTTSEPVLRLWNDNRHCPVQ